MTEVAGLTLGLVAMGLTMWGVGWTRATFLAGWPELVWLRGAEAGARVGRLGTEDTGAGGAENWGAGA